MPVCILRLMNYVICNIYLVKAVFYSLQMACSNIRYGPGVTQEVGMDLANMGAKKVGVYTDKNLAGNYQLMIYFS